MAEIKSGASHPSKNTKHRITLRAREELFCEGVEEIISYNETEVVLKTSEGMLIVGGKKLAISSLSVDIGELRVFGTIVFMEYKEPKPSGFFARVMR